MFSVFLIINAHGCWVSGIFIASFRIYSLFSLYFTLLLGFCLRDRFAIDCAHHQPVPPNCRPIRNRFVGAIPARGTEGDKFDDEDALALPKKAEVLMTSWLMHRLLAALSPLISIALLMVLPLLIA